jgi:hypothetical protein
MGETASVANPTSSSNNPPPPPAGPFNSSGGHSIPDGGGTFTGRGDVAQPPAVPGGDTPGKGVTAVNTAAMKTFATNLASLETPLQELKTYLSEVNVKPGGFRSAAALEKKTTDLKTSSVDAVSGLIGAITTLSDKIAKAALAYDTADDANNMSSTDYANYFGQVTTDVNNLGKKG